MNLATIRKNLSDAEQAQIQTLTEMRKKHPGYFCAAPFDLFGPAVRLADGDGDEYAELWAEIQWTDNAAEYIRNQEYRYISPEFDLDFYDEKKGKHIGGALLAVGLTNRPFLKGMAPVELADGADTSEIMVMMTGHWHHLWYGEFSVSVADLDEMITNFDITLVSANPESGHPATEMVVDYNHGSLIPDPESAKAAGWVRGKKIFKKLKAKKATEPALTGTYSAGTLPNTPSEPSGEKPAVRPQSGGKVNMNEARIRELLGLGEGVEVTDDHRNQALELLDKQNTELAAGNKALTDAVGEGVEPGQIPAMLTEGKLPGKVILTEAEHTELKKNADSFIELRDSAGDSLPLTAEGLKTLQEKADAGAEAAKKLHERDVEAVLNDKRVVPAEKDELRKLAATAGGLETVRKLISVRPQNAQLFSETGSGADESNNAEQVGDFIKTRETELLTSKQASDSAQAYSMALREARQKFDAETMHAYEYPKK